MANTAEISCPNFPQIILKVKRPNHQILRPSQNPIPDSQNNLHALIIHQIHQLYDCCVWFVDCISSDYIAIWPRSRLEALIGRITNSSQGRIQLQAFEFMQPRTLQTVPIIDFVNITTNSIESPRGLIGSVNSLFVSESHCDF